MKADERNSLHSWVVTSTLTVFVCLGEHGFDCIVSKMSLGVKVLMHSSQFNTLLEH